MFDSSSRNHFRHGASTSPGRFRRALPGPMNTRPVSIQSPQGWYPCRSIGGKRGHSHPGWGKPKRTGQNAGATDGLPFTRSDVSEARRTGGKRQYAPIV